MQEPKTHLSRLLARVEQGESILLARAGRPIARIVPISPGGGGGGGRELGFVDYRLPDAFIDPLADDELRAWEG